MSEVVNLRRFRKRKEREDKEHQSKQNRILHGTPKKLREKQSKIEALKTSRLDGKKFEGNDWMGLRKHSVSIRGHQTSFSLEDEFWIEFKSIAKQQGKPVARLITEIDESRPTDQNLSSALRLHVLNALLGKSVDNSEQA